MKVSLEAYQRWQRTKDNTTGKVLFLARMEGGRITSVYAVDKEVAVVEIYNRWQEYPISIE
jgi:hypothetical protein